MLEVTDATFEQEVLNSEMPVVVDFWAPWCAPCMSFMPTLEDLEQMEQHRVKFVKVNVDENELIPSEYGIRTVPTLLIVKEGEVKQFVTGVKSKGQLDSLISGL